MAKARSPLYPAIGLKEAVHRVRAVYEKDYQNRVPREVIAQHMGYSGLSGKSLGVLSALQKYGLLEGRGDETRVSPLAVKIIAHESGTPERAEAIRAAASMPELFAELDARFGDGKGSDAALKAWLLVEGFIPGAAESAIRAYRETKEFVREETGTFSSTVPALISEPPPKPFYPVIDGANQVSAMRELMGPDDDVLPPEGMRKAVFTLTEGDVSIVFPEDMHGDSLDDLESYIKIWLGRLRREAAKRQDS